MIYNEYALLGVSIVAEIYRRTKGPDDFTKLSDIAERVGISVSYAEQIAAKLRRAGIIVSARGPNGGYALPYPAAQTMIIDIIHALPVKRGRDKNVTTKASKNLDLMLSAAIVSRLEGVSLLDIL